MSGARGLQNIKNISEALKKRCYTDLNCSMHIHIGNIPTDRTFMSALYILCYKIQDDVFKMFPYYKTDPSGIKQKNYCQKLKKMSIHPIKDVSKEGYETYINDVYGKLFYFLSDGLHASQGFNRSFTRHPITRKWERPSRYFWINLQNMIFSDRGTCEARLHDSTLNHQKIINWLFMMNAVIKYAENNVESIIKSSKKIPFIEVLDYYKEAFPKNKEAAFLSSYLKEYYLSRCTQFENDLRKGDKVSEYDLKNDKNYVFGYEGVTDLF